MAKVLGINTDGSYGEIQPVTASAGAGSAGDLVQLDSTGKFDISTMLSQLSKINV